MAHLLDIADNSHHPTFLAVALTATAPPSPANSMPNPSSPPLSRRSSGLPRPAQSDPAPTAIQRPSTSILARHARTPARPHADQDHGPPSPIRAPRPQSRRNHARCGPGRSSLTMWPRTQQRPPASERSSTSTSARHARPHHADHHHDNDWSRHILRTQKGQPIIVIHQYPVQECFYLT